jgi:hypothetical protein
MNSAAASTCDCAVASMSLHLARSLMQSLSTSRPIEVAGIVVRVEAGVNPGWLADVLRAAKAA